MVVVNDGECCTIRPTSRGKVPKPLRTWDGPKLWGVVVGDAKSWRDLVGFPQTLGFHEDFMRFFIGFFMGSHGDSIRI